MPRKRSVAPRAVARRRPTHPHKEKTERPQNYPQRNAAKLPTGGEPRRCRSPARGRGGTPPRGDQMRGLRRARSGARGRGTRRGVPLGNRCPSAPNAITRLRVVVGRATLLCDGCRRQSVTQRGAGACRRAGRGILRGRPPPEGRTTTRAALHARRPPRPIGGAAGVAPRMATASRRRACKVLVLACV